MLGVRGFRSARLLGSVPVRTQQKKGPFRNAELWNELQPRDDDIIIATPYKTGTTWMQQITNQLLCGGNPEVWPIHPELGPHSTGLWVEFPVGPPNKSELLNNMTTRRVLKTHLSTTGVPYNPSWRYLFVLRDPRDVCASMFNHAISMQKDFLESLGEKTYTQADFDTWFKDVFMMPDNQRTDWCYFQWVSEVWPWRHLSNFKFINYNNLLNNTRQEIADLAKFCNIPVTEGVLDAVTENSSFSFMKKNEKYFEPPEQLMTRGRFINKGKIGNHKNLLSEEHKEAILNRSKEVCGDEATEWLITGK
eukprot:TRINITY_DN96020_c0_g1_i1.p1 TRINITY_DN96020_c0_g1~~TRINITY_DN96020_c0_g1_i1.p1  ORF type:complete len:306 (-),score=28.63 TRINITY_DN96020_c0_g1_i1:129-1046(-)